MSPLILASGSPRRKQLLRQAGFDFEIRLPRIPERADAHLSPRELTSWNAVRKGLHVARLHPDMVVIAADTVVALGNTIIGKPADARNAVRILEKLSGRTHQVYTSVFVAHLARTKVNLFCAISDVHFRKLGAHQIRDYLARIDPLDKAGAYAAQGYGTQIIKRIDGSYSNVVGLPMEQTTTVLGKFGIRPNKNRSPK